MMNTLDIATSCGLNPKKVASTKGGEYHSSCPMCGGTDRFHLWPEQPGTDHGSFWCRGCGKGGDAIQLLRDAKQMGYKEACRYLNIEPKADRPEQTPVVPKRQGSSWAPRETHSPADIWQAKASAFVTFAHKELLKNPDNKDQLDWLKARGITRASVERFKLGWNPKTLWRDRTQWDMEPGKKLWFPVGLVIPWSVGGKVLRIRIRRHELKEENDSRYILVAGSNMTPMAIPCSGTGPTRVWSVIEAELDAILVAQEAGDVVGAMAMGNSSAKPDTAALALLDAADQILVSLDADYAGAKSSLWWTERFTQADRWRVPGAKDPGDYYKAGSNIRAWILAGLAPGLRPASPVPVAPLGKPPPQAREKKQRPIDKNVIDRYEVEGLIPWLLVKHNCPKCGVLDECWWQEGAPRHAIPCTDCLSKNHKNKEFKHEHKAAGSERRGVQPAQNYSYAARKAQKVSR